ncbi:hypothetical protein EVAR_101839_1 [Eumeta japonica]|uniref:Uncharacterized protein n=1 Tax=Eumeta variegata TaxID=151549 RepID=A0A4C1SQM1_EUMVA|nr:hypothetical protein EVAR_101839_1 [Eumeta japonica]
MELFTLFHRLKRQDVSPPVWCAAAKSVCRSYTQLARLDSPMVVPRSASTAASGVQPDFVSPGSKIDSPLSCPKIDCLTPLT